MARCLWFAAVSYFVLRVLSAPVAAQYVALLILVAAWLCIRRRHRLWLASAISVLVAGTAAAQITLIPGPQYPVPQAPELIAVADFNGDGIPDGAVTDATSGLVSVLFAARDGTFASHTSFSVGREHRGIVAGDLNCDGNADIAVVDSSDGQLFVVMGNGDGTFNRPATYQTGGGPVDIAIGNFDGQGCTDITVVTQADSSAAVFLNLNPEPGFAVREFPVGGVPKRVAAVDLNGDGFDDLVTIMSPVPDVDTISVLINTGDGAFLSPRQFTPAAMPTDFAIADFNNDGRPDIAALSAVAEPVLNQFSVSVLLHRGAVIADSPLEVGFLDTSTPVVLRCPGTLGGLLTLCSPNSITAADFDADGRTDLAVSFSTQPVAGRSKTPGLIEVFAGWGEATFDFATVVSIGSDPYGVVAADFTDDSIVDIAVTERGTSTARIIRATTPPLHIEPGCRVGSQCTSGFCVDGVCCSEGVCPAGQFCDIPGEQGHCAAPGRNGAPCLTGIQCSSGSCVDGTCCASRACDAGLFCNTGTCAPPAALGASCSWGEQCQSGFCVDDICSVSSTAYPTPPPTPQPASSIVLSNPTGAPGDRVTVAVTLYSGTAIAGIQNDLTFDTGAPIVAGTNGRPDCTVNPAINKRATSFAFRPSACTPGVDCTAIRAVVVSTDNVDAIADGALLYTCTVRIGDSTPPGSYPQAVVGELAADPDGNQVPLSGVDGAIIVITPPGATPLPTWTVSPTPSPKPPTPTYTRVPTSTPVPTRGPTNTPRPSVAISVGSATAGPNESIAVAVTLVSGEYPVAGIQADIIVDAGIAIAARPNGKPDCQVNPDIDKPATGFSFFPPGCTPGVSCTGMRALVLAVDNVDAIPDGAVLYTCRVQVDSHAPPGTYRLWLLGAVASDPTGEAWSVVLNNGDIDVVTPPGATPIPTWTPGPVVVGVPPAAPKSSDGQACDPTAPPTCATGFCTNEVCCETERCADGQRCDIFGFEGTCTPPQARGLPCSKESDCASGVHCLYDPAANGFICGAAPLPTPTFIPFTPQPTDLGPLDTSRQGLEGDGCSLSEPRRTAFREPFALLSLALVGLLRLGGRRRRLRAGEHHACKFRA